MIPNTSAFAAFTRNGSSAPPAPRSFIAFHSPGAMNPTPPITNALNSDERYHLRGSASEGGCEVGSVSSCSTDGALASEGSAIV
jgi:hypothetical protein